VLRAPSSATHVIVVPTALISGIESPALLRENAPNYWEAAWDARRFVEEGARRPLPRDKIGMAINSALAAARTSCIFMLPASPRRSLSSCVAIKRKFTKLGLFSTRPFAGTDLRR
jgi:CDP-diacylglycerol pyrophosphatase